MADFQTAVNLIPAKGIPGGTASINPILSAPFNYHAKEAVVIGRFVWDNGDGTVSGTSTEADAAPVGFAHLDRIYTLENAYAGASLEVPAGATVEVVTGGDFYAIPSEAVTRGSAVYANATTGELTGSEGDGVDTGFVWAEDVDEGAIGVITTNF